MQGDIHMIGQLQTARRCKREAHEWRDTHVFGATRTCVRARAEVWAWQLAGRRVEGSAR